MIELDGAGQPPCPGRLRRLGAALEEVGCAAVEQDRGLVGYRVLHRVDVGAQLRVERDRIGRRRLAGAPRSGFDLAQRIAAPADHAACQDRCPGVAGDLERPIDAGRGAEISDRRSGRDDDRMVLRQKPDPAEQGRERGVIREQAGRHSLGGAPTVLRVVGVDRSRNVPGLIGFPGAAVDDRANIEDQQDPSRQGDPPATPARPAARWTDVQPISTSGPALHK